MDITNIKEGYINDFISGQLVRSTPEEIEAVQVFSRQLVEDYDYPKGHIQTRPQFHVKARPSDLKKEYPVDIVVFRNGVKEDGNEYIIVECKKKNRKDGRSQLEDYLRFSRARVGVWFNGAERLFLTKHEKNGSIIFEEIPNIPSFRQRVEDIGQFKRKDLKITHNLKTIFRTIRNYLAANAVGVTRDEVFAQQLINLIFCKIYDERFTKSDEIVNFRAGIDEEANEVASRIIKLFDLVKKQYGDVIDESDNIILDPKSITYVVGELQQYCLTQTERDVIADAFETFIGPSLKGGQGQFFTPRNVVKLIIGIVDPSTDEKILDPACGSGGFLVESLRHVWKKVEENGKGYGWPEHEIFAEKQKVAIKNLRGIDKDSFLSKVAKAYMALLGDGRGGVHCENSLENPKRWSNKTNESLALNSFDVVMTNPPFGKKLKITDTELLKQYSLGHQWKETDESFSPTNVLLDAQTPQILFVERCLALLKDGGRLGIIAPESMFSNPTHKFIVEYIQTKAKIEAIISLPEELFQPYTHAKTCVVVIQKTSSQDKNEEIFMAIAKWCGHDSRGIEIPYDDIPKILNRYEEYKKNKKLTYDHLGFIVKRSQIVNNIYLPRYYNPEIEKALHSLKLTHDIMSVGELQEKGLIEIKTGDEAGKLAYGTGTIPFVRSSDIANWEIKIDPKHGLSRDLFERYKKKQDVRENDILMVRDGTYLVGTCALVTKTDEEIVYQSHIYKIRSKKPDELHPYLLLALLSCPLVKKQIYSKRFTQDIIDTLGGRVYELMLPIPKNKSVITKIIKDVETVILSRITAKKVAKQLLLAITPINEDDEEQASFVINE